jgi:hypothetical protein
MLELILIVVFFALLIGIFRRLQKPRYQRQYQFVDRWSTPSEIADASAANRIHDGLPPTPPTADEQHRAFHEYRRTLR